MKETIRDLEKIHEKYQRRLDSLALNMARDFRQTLKNHNIPLRVKHGKGYVGGVEKMVLFGWFRERICSDLNGEILFSELRESFKKEEK